MPMKPKSYIIETIKEIYETHQIGELGFDIVALCKNMGYAVIPYSSLSKEKQDAYVSFDKDGFSLYNPKTQQCEIYYNDNIYTKERMVYTISHELGHIELGHVFEEEPTLEMEEDAIEFARQFYTPQVLLFHKNIRTPNKIMEIFKVSYQYSIVLYRRLEDRLSYYGPVFDENEMMLWSNFVLYETIKHKLWKEK